MPLCIEVVTNIWNLIIESFVNHVCILLHLLIYFVDTAFLPTIHHGDILLDSFRGTAAGKFCWVSNSANCPLFSFCSPKNIGNTVHLFGIWYVEGLKWCLAVWIRFPPVDCDVAVARAVEGWVPLATGLAWVAGGIAATLGVEPFGSAGKLHTNIILQRIWKSNIQ